MAGPAAAAGKFVMALGLDTKLFEMGMSKAGEAISKFSKKAQFGIGAAATAFSTFVVGNINEATQWETAWKRVWTTAPSVSEAAMRKMGDRIKTWARANALSTGEAASAWQVYSATIGEVENAERTLETARQVALATGSDTIAATESLTTILNAYNLETEEAVKIGDQLVVMYQMTGASIQELEQVLSTAVGTTADFNVSLDETLAMAIASKRGGDDLGESMAQIRQVTVQLASSNRRAGRALREHTGQTFEELTAKGWTTYDMLLFLKDALGGNSEAVVNLFERVQAAQLGLLLTGKGADNMSEAMMRLDKSTGQAESTMGKMQDTVSFKFEKLKTKWQDFIDSVLNNKGLVEFFKGLLDVLTWIVDKLTYVGNFWSEVFGAVGDAVTSLGSVLEGEVPGTKFFNRAAGWVGIETEDAKRIREHEEDVEKRKKYQLYLMEKERVLRTEKLTEEAEHAAFMEGHEERILATKQQQANLNYQLEQQGWRAIEQAVMQAQRQNKWNETLQYYVDNSYDAIMARGDAFDAALGNAVQKLAEMGYNSKQIRDFMQQGFENIEDVDSALASAASEMDNLNTIAEKLAANAKEIKLHLQGVADPLSNLPDGDPGFGFQTSWLDDQPSTQRSGGGGETAAERAERIKQETYAKNASRMQALQGLAAEYAALGAQDLSGRGITDRRFVGMGWGQFISARIYDDQQYKKRYGLEAHGLSEWQTTDFTQGAFRETSRADFQSEIDKEQKRLADIKAEADEAERVRQIREDYAADRLIEENKKKYQEDQEKARAEKQKEREERGRLEREELTKYADIVWNAIMKNVPRDTILSLHTDKFFSKWGDMLGVPQDFLYTSNAMIARELRMRHNDWKAEEIANTKISRHYNIGQNQGGLAQGFLGKMGFGAFGRPTSALSFGTTYDYVKDLECNLADKTDEQTQILRTLAELLRNKEFTANFTGITNGYELWQELVTQMKMETAHV